MLVTAATTTTFDVQGRARCQGWKRLAKVGKRKIAFLAQMLYTTRFVCAYNYTHAIDHFI
jgi:hypothetical protein